MGGRGGGLLPSVHCFSPPSLSLRDMENIRRGPTPSGICHYTLRDVDAGTSQLQDYIVVPIPPSFTCNVLRESLSVDKYSLRNTKEKGVVGNLCTFCCLLSLHYIYCVREKSNSTDTHTQFQSHPNIHPASISLNNH